MYQATINWYRRTGACRKFFRDITRERARLMRRWPWSWTGWWGIISDSKVTWLIIFDFPFPMIICKISNSKKKSQLIALRFRFLMNELLLSDFITQIWERKKVVAFLSLLFCHSALINLIYLTFSCVNLVCWVGQFFSPFWPASAMQMLSCVILALSKNRTSSKARDKWQRFKISARRP